MMEDLLGWMAVMVGGILMHFWDLPFIDPLLSVLIAVWVLFNVYKNLSSAISIMLQEVPRDVDINDLNNDFKSIGKVDSIHDLHVWTLDGENHIMSVHLVMQENVTRDEVQKAKEILKEIAMHRGIGHVTVEVEFCDEASCCSYYKDPC